MFQSQRDSPDAWNSVPCTQREKRVEDVLRWGFLFCTSGGATSEKKKTRLRNRRTAVNELGVSWANLMRGKVVKPANRSLLLLTRSWPPLHEAYREKMAAHFCQG